MNTVITHTFLSVLVVVIAFPLFSQTHFIKTFGGPDHDIGMAVRQTDDDGYALFGQTNSFGAGGRDMFLIKCDEQGELRWEAAYGTNEFDLGISFEETTDGGFILVGVMNIGGDSLALIKTDVDGNVEWFKQYSGSMATNVGRFVQQTTDGGFIVIGFEGDFGEGDLQLLKVDEAGNQEWLKQLERPGKQTGYCIRQVADGGFIIVGDTNHDTLTKQDIYVVRTDAAGDTIWTRQIDEGGFEVGFSIDINGAGEYVLVGHGQDETADIILAGIDDTGDEVFRKFFGGSFRDAAYYVQVTSDGYIIAGYKGLNEHDTHMLALKTDDLGNLEWERVYPLGVNSDATSVDITTDGGFVLLGSTLTMIDSALQYDFYMVKVDSLGYTLVPTDWGTVGYALYPNPVIDEATLTLHDPFRIVDLIDIVDVNGREVDSYEVRRESHMLIDAGHLLSGMYFVVLRSGRKIVATGKLFVP